MAQTTKVSRSLKIYLDGKEFTNSVKDIRAEMRQVKRELDNAQIGSDEYRRSMEKLGTLNGILEEHKNQIKEIKHEGESLFTKAKYWIKQGFFTKIGINSLDALKNKLLEFRDLFNQKESSASNLKALTGLDDSSIQWLTNQAERLSTTMDETGLRVSQSSQEILEAYMLVGSAKPELLGDKEALNAVTIEAMRLAQAAKMDLKDAVDGVTLALNQYGAGADEAARYVNVLAAGSKAGAADVQSQTAAIIKAGVAASTAGIPIEQLVGSIETLAEKGIKSEVAGTGLKTFFLKLETMADDCRPSVVGLQTALENLAAKNLTTEQMMEAFGEGTYTVAQAMISSSDAFRQYTEAVTGTSIAVEQAAINSDTTEVKMAQLTNMINEQGMAIWEALAPAYNLLLQGMSGVLSVLSAMISFITQHIGLIGALAAVITLYNTRIAITKALESAWNTIKKTGIGLQRIWTLQLNTSAAATARYTTALKSTNTITMLLFQANLLLKGVLATMTFQITAAKNAFHALGVAIKANPLGLIISLATAAYGIFSSLFSKTEKVKEATIELTQTQKDYIEAQKEANAQTIEVKTRIQELSRIIHDNASSYDDKRQAIANLQKIVPGYQASLSREGQILRENQKAINDYIRTLDKMAMAEAAYNKVVELNQKILDKQTELNTKAANLKHLTENEPTKYKESYHVAIDDKTGETSEFVIRERTEEWEDWMHNFVEGKSGITRGLVELNAYKEEKKAIYDYVESDTELVKYFNQRIHKGSSLFSAPLGGGSAAVAPKTTPTSSGRRPQTPTKSSPAPKSGTGNGNDEDKKRQEEEEKRIRAEIEKIELDYQKRLNDIKERYRNGDIQSEEQYQQELEALLVETLQRKMQVQGLSEEQQVQLLAKVRDIYVKHRQQLNQILDDIGKDQLTNDQKQLQEINDEAQQKIETLQQYHEMGLLSEQAFQDAVIKILQEAGRKRQEAWRTSEEYQAGIDALNKYLQTRTEAFQQANTDEGFGAFSGISALQQEIQTVQSYMQTLSTDSPEYQALQDYMGGLEAMVKEKGKAIIDITSQIGESLGTALGNAINGSKDGIKSALKSVLNIILDAVEKMILASMVVPSVEAIAGPAGWAKAAVSLAKIAAVKVAFAAVKASVQNFDTGGFTGPGQWNQPRGIVHAGEFVANRFAVANPAVRPLLDLIDNAQRSGNIRTLTADDVAAVATPVAARHTASKRQDDGTRQLIASTAQAINQLNERLSQPIIAHTYATGKFGTIEAEQLAEKMRNNSRRRTDR